MAPSVFDPALEHVTAARTSLSDVDGENGELIVGGYPIEQLASKASYEEVCYLLRHGRLPTEDELAAFNRSLTDCHRLSDETRRAVKQAAESNRSPMAALRMGIAAVTTEDDDSMDATRLVAVVPTIVATYWCYRQGRSPVEPRTDLGHAANFLYMLTGAEPTAAECRGFETFLTTMIDHGLNPSTFTARVVTSTGSDLVSSATAAVGALNGVHHGGGFESVFEMLQAAHTADDCEKYVRDRLAEASTLPGFGHRVYQVRDPRAAVLSAASERFYDESGGIDFLDTAKRVESVGSEYITADRTESRPAPTVEFYATALLYGVGIPSKLFTAAFAVSRIGGWMAHCLEQREANTLVRPVAQYEGSTDRTWTPVENRYTAGDSIVQQPLQASSLEPVSETLAALSEPSRLEILLALYDADDSPTYSQLQTCTSIDDKGRFNYHLRQLRESFVRKGSNGYTLTDAGETVVDTVVNDDKLLR